MGRRTKNLFLYVLTFREILAVGENCLVNKCVALEFFFYIFEFVGSFTEPYYRLSVIRLSPAKIMGQN